jgi:heptosyltransferase-2
MKFNRDCKSFPGVYACDIMISEDYNDCEECKFYEKISKKILIIKLGAIGDIIRTTPILPALKKKYGSNIHITWVVSKESEDVLKNNEQINKILVYNEKTILRLQQEKFDILLSLEIAPPATHLANLVKADEKFGYYFNEDSHPSAFNEEAQTYLNIVFSNKVNKNTKKTYQEMIFEIIKLFYEKQNYLLKLNEQEKEYGKNLINEEKLIGINVGAAGRWLSKSWHSSKILDLIKKIYKETNYKVVLLGGKKEEQLKKELKETLEKENIKVLENNSNNTIREYMSVINQCDKIITNDSLALHIAIGLGKETIALFFCTPSWQIETYDVVTILESPLLDKYFMDDQYHEDLVNSISVEEVFEKI